MPSIAIYRTVPALLALCLVACGGGSPDTRPVQGDGTDTPLVQAQPEEVGLPAGVWPAVLRELDDRGMQVDQIGVMVDGRLVGARHYGAHSPTTLHDLRSVTKSITSLLVGIAIDRGLLAGIDEPIDRFFPELPPHPSRAAFGPLTLRHLLTMRSGLDCNDWDSSAGNEEAMYRSSDWVRFFYNIPARAEPGSRFTYCTAGVVVLGEVVARAAGRPLPQFAQEVLFEPLGIRNARWAPAAGGATDAGGHLRLSLDGLLKLGELMRQGGRWQGRQVVSPAWVEASVRSAGRVEEPGLQAHMGHLWWLEPVRDGQARSYQARGNGGQLLIVVPEVKLVVAATGRAYNASGPVQWAPFGLVERWLIPALKGRPVPATAAN